MDPKAAAHFMSAFPTFAKSGDVALSEGGLTMRDWFAAQAVVACAEACRGDTRFPGETQAELIARRSYELADAMLKAREA